MFGLRYAFGIFCLLILSASAAFSQSANYPDKPVTIISDSPAGSSPDVVARFVAEGARQALGATGHCPQQAGRKWQPCRPRRVRSPSRRLHLISCDAVDLCGTADNRAESPGQAATRLRGGGLRLRSADVRRRLADTRRLDAATVDRPRQKGAGQNHHCRHRHWPAHASDRRTFAGARRHQARGGAVYARTSIRNRRHRRRPRVDDHRRLFPELPAR